MNEVFDYPTTPADLKCLANTIAGYLGYARKSKKSIDGFYTKQFVAIESITCAVGWKLVIVRKNGMTIDLFPDIGELAYEEFRYFLKGLVIGLIMHQEEEVEEECATETAMELVKIVPTESE